MGSTPGRGLRDVGCAGGRNGIEVAYISPAGRALSLMSRNTSRMGTRLLGTGSQTCRVVATVTSRVGRLVWVILWVFIT